MSTALIFALLSAIEPAIKDVESIVAEIEGGDAAPDKITKVAESIAGAVKDGVTAYLAGK